MSELPKDYLGELPQTDAVESIDPFEAHPQVEKFKGLAAKYKGHTPEDEWYKAAAFNGLSEGEASAMSYLADVRERESRGEEAERRQFKDIDALLRKQGIRIDE